MVDHCANAKRLKSNFRALLSDKRGQLIWEYMKKNPIPLFPNYGRDSAP